MSATCTVLAAALCVFLIATANAAQSDKAGLATMGIPLRAGRAQARSQ